MISFFVQGLPKPAGSKRGFFIPKIKRVVIVDACKGSKDWKTDVKFEAQRNYSGPPMEGPLSVSFVFQMPRPKSHYGSGKNASVLKPNAPSRPITKPDVLKLARAVEDALTGIAWRDDSQIAVESLEKVYHSTTGVRITVDYVA